MKITVAVTSIELKEMDLSADDLEYIIIDRLDKEGDDLVGYNVFIDELY